MKKKLQYRLKKTVSWMLSLVLISGICTLAWPLNAVAATPNWTGTGSSAPYNVSCMVEVNGTIYAGSKDNSGVWTCSNGVWTPMSGSPSTVYSMAKGADGTIYVGNAADDISKPSISYYSNGTWTVMVKPPSNHVLSLLVIKDPNTNDDVLYAGTADGVYKYNTGTTDWTTIHSSMCTYSLTEGASSTLYAGTPQGVWSYSGGSWTQIYADSSLQEIPQSLAYVDSDSTLYFGAGDGKALSYNGTACTQMNGTPDFAGLCAEINGTLYAGAHDGLYAWDGTAWTKIPGSPLNVISMLYMNGTIYAGTVNATWRCSNGAWEPVAPGRINTIQIVGSAVYAGTDDAVWRYSSGSWTPLRCSPAWNVKSLLYMNGKLYAGTFTGSSINDVWCYDGSWTQMSSSPDEVSSLKELNGILYAGTWYNGVYSYDNGVWTNISGSVNTGKAPLEVLNGTLYVGANDGIYYYNGGVSWSKIPDTSGPSDTLAAAKDLSAKDYLYAGASGYVWIVGATGWGTDGSITMNDMTYAGGIVYAGTPEGLRYKTPNSYELVSGTPAVVNCLEYADGSIYTGANGLYIYSAPVMPYVTTISLPNGTVGVPYSMTLEAAGDTPITWGVVNSIVPAGLSLSTVGVLSGTPTTAGYNEIKIKVTNPYGNAYIDYPLGIFINASSGASIDIQPANRTVTPGSTATFTVTAQSNDGGTLSYQWTYSKNGGGTWSDVTGGAGATADSYTTDTLSTANSGTLYRCIVTDSIGGPVASNPATLTVSTAPVFTPVTDITGVPATATAGTPLTLTGTVAPTNATNQTIVWSVQNAGTTGATLNGSTLSTTAEGSVTARATITNGLTESSDYTQDFTITVNPAPVTDATISPATGSFDKHTPADVQTTVTWGSATGVTDVKAGGISIGADNYSVSGNTLTIKKEYLAAQATGSLTLTMEFNAGAAATLTITVTDTTPPTISPVLRNYDLSNPADVTTAITWNSAVSVSDVVYSVSPDTTLYTLGTGDYTVSDDALTIKNSFFSGLSLTTGAALEFDITFNTGATSTLTVNVVNNYTPSADADLSSLSVNGTPVSGFDPDDTEYAVQLPYGAASATVTATASDSKAQVSITQASALPGSATVTVTAENGTTSRTYTINLTITPPAFVPVTGITGVPTTATTGANLTLSGTVAPANATNKTIVWSVYSAGDTGATISGNTLSTTAAGTVTVRATITNGLTTSTDYTQDFTITVSTVPVTTYTVTFNSNGTVYTTKTVNAGESIGSTAWPADPTRSSYTFGGWFTGENGSGTQFTSATPVNATTTVYAKWTYSGGGGSPSGSGSTAPATSTYNAEVNTGNGSSSTLPVTVDKSGSTASVDVSSGNSLLSDGKTTVITVPAVPGVDTYILGIPVPSLSTQNEQGALTFDTDWGSVTVPSNMLTGADGISGSKAEIFIGQGEKFNLPNDIKNAIGDRPLVQLTLSIDGKQTGWNNPSAPVTVTIPYTPTAAELANPENIVIWYIDGSGNAVSVPNGHYDPATGTVTFTTTHFSNYAVVYNKVSFTDASDTAWYSDAVGFISARGITTGTGNGCYSPDAKLTRGEFMVMMMRAYGIAPDTNSTDNFADAGNTYYTGYLATAKRLEISVGVGNNMFAPAKEITRQEMFTLLYNALKVIGQLPEGNSGKTLSDFNDAGQIDSWAKHAMTLLVETGTISGCSGKLNPASTTTRAEMAQVLYNLLSK